MNKIDKLAEAIALTAQAHAGQHRSSGEPYIFHPLRVMMAIASEPWSSKDEVIVAVLHDVVEDSPIENSDILMRFGATIGMAVDALTRKADEDYVSMIDRVKANAIARDVKPFDIRDNLDSLPRSTFRIGKKVELAARYLRALEQLSVREEG